jgi:ABC-type sugar transport system permease subunit
MVEVKKTDVKRKRRFNSLESKKSLYGWVFVSPFVLGFLLIFVWIFIDSFNFSLNEVGQNPDGYTLRFAGFDNYNYAWNVNTEFTRDLIDSVSNMLLMTPVIIIFSLFIAVILNKGLAGRSFFRSIFFIPVILTTGIILKADIATAVSSAYADIEDAGSQLASNSMFDPDMVMEYLQSIFNFSSVLTDVLVGMANNIYSVVNSSGVQILIFLAGLQAISPSIYESAEIEGATGWEAFWKITVPMISPLILTNVIYSIIDSFTSPFNAVIDIIYNTAFVSAEYGRASAMAWSYFLVIIVCVTVTVMLINKFIFYENRER